MAGNMWGAEEELAAALGAFRSEAGATDVI